MSTLDTDEKIQVTSDKKRDLQGQISGDIHENGSAQTEHVDLTTVNGDCNIKKDTIEVSSIEKMENPDVENKRLKTENNNEVAMIENTLVREVNQLNITDEHKVKSQQHKSAAVIVNKESNSLKSLLVYESDDSSSNSSEADWQLKLNQVHSSSSSSSEESSDETESLSEDDSDVEITAIERMGAIKKTDTKKKEPAKTPGELMYEDLPPVPDHSKLNLNMEQQDFTHMGHILSLMNKLVTVEAIPDVPAYDLDTFLFFGEEKKPLGQVFDVLGPVTSPIYAIRFNSAEEIKRMQLKQGMKIYSAPKSEYTQYVFLKQLLKMKGSDASWIGDNEVPADMEEYSDDDAEYYTTTGTKRWEPRPTKRPHSSLERHQRFERTMNKCNTLNTRVQRLVDAHNPSSRPNVIRSDTSQMHFTPQPHQPVLFDPRVPPPGFPMPPNVPSGSEGGYNYFPMPWNECGQNSGGGFSGGNLAYNGAGGHQQFYHGAGYFTNNLGRNPPGPSNGKP